MPGYALHTEVSANTTLTTTDEVVVATIGGCSNSAPGKPIRFKGQAKITTGADTTAVNLRIRKGSVTGTEVTESNPTQIEVAAGSTEDHDISGADVPSGEQFNETYVLTAQQTAATANGTCVYAYFEAICE